MDRTIPIVPPKTVTLADVAARAGVSLATASKALADRYDVRASTKERVLKVATDMDFTPNLLARGLQGGRTQSVGLITSDLDGRFAPQIMMGVEDALGADRSSVIMCNSRGDSDLETHHIRELLRRAVDGLIVVGNYAEPRSPIALDVAIPTVYTYAYSTAAEDVSVACDNFEAGRLAAQHLISLGRSKIHHIGGEAGLGAAREREAGTRAALQEAGLTPVVGEPRFGLWSEQWGWTETARLIEAGIEFDGLVCGNDQIARGALDQLELSQHHSDDVSVIGFDNWSVLCRDSRRPFSSVDMNLPDLGRTAARALIDPEAFPPGIHKIVGRVDIR